jgi:hypothetical protein
LAETKKTFRNFLGGNKIMAAMYFIDWLNMDSGVLLRGF